MTEAVIMAAGKGKRLGPVTKEIPKAMAPVCGVPVLERLMKQLKEVGVDHVVMVVHYFKEQIIKYFGIEFEGIKITYAEQKQLMGTADAVKTAEPHIKDDKFFVIACDSLFETELLNKLSSHDADGVLTVCEVKDPKPFGVITHDNGRVTGIVEKSQDPPSNLANTSIYLFSKKIFDACGRITQSERGEYEITDAIQLLIDEGAVFEYEVINDWLDIGTAQELEEAQKLGKTIS